MKKMNEKKKRRFEKRDREKMRGERHIESREQSRVHSYTYGIKLNTL